MTSDRLGNAAATFIALALAGCALAPERDTPFAVPDGEWELVTSSLVEIGRLPGMARPTLAFHNGRVSAFSGCNRGEGHVADAQGRLAVQALTLTKRACPEPIGSFESRYFQLLRDAPVYRVEGDTLLIVAGDYNARFRRR